MRPQNTRFSRALMSGYRAMSWGTTPMGSLTACASVTTEWPSTRASPPLGASRQQSMEMVVLLPAPLGPSRLKISPSVDGEADAVDGQHALGRVVLLAQLLAPRRCSPAAPPVVLDAVPRYTRRPGGGHYRVSAIRLAVWAGLRCSSFIDPRAQSVYYMLIKHIGMGDILFRGSGPFRNAEKIK